MENIKRRGVFFPSELLLLIREMPGTTDSRHFTKVTIILWCLFKSSMILRLQYAIRTAIMRKTQRNTGIKTFYLVWTFQKGGTLLEWSRNILAIFRSFCWTFFSVNESLIHLVLCIWWQHRRLRFIIYEICEKWLRWSVNKKKTLQQLSTKLGNFNIVISLSTGNWIEFSRNLNFKL